MLKRRKQAPSWRVSDELWERVEPLLPRYRKSKAGGRPRADARQVLNGILYVLRTGCQWKEAPREFGAPSTLHDYFQEWTEKGVFWTPSPSGSSGLSAGHGSQASATPSPSWSWSSGPA